ncbi:MAG: hypothetical protein V3V13_07465 [Paracoccaceae bacterium]
MAQYIIAYRGGAMPKTPEEGAAGMAKWKAWAVDLGEAIVNPGTPLGKSMIVSAQGVSDDAGPDALMGYTIVEAENMDAALEMAKICPHIDMEGATLEVAQLMQMGGS